VNTTQRGSGRWPRAMNCKRVDDATAAAAAAAAAAVDAASWSRVGG